jgi:hypothetical protein
MYSGTFVAPPTSYKESIRVSILLEGVRPQQGWESYEESIGVSILISVSIGYRHFSAILVSIPVSMVFLPTLSFPR